MISEVEAKFSVSDAETFQRLKSLEKLAGFGLSAGKLIHAHDVFLDTPDRKLSSAGYVCRRRESEGRTIITIKGAAKVRGAVHEREEIECEVPDARLSVAEWPRGNVREKLLSLIGKSSLLPLFEQGQARFMRALTKQGREIAELSLDEVIVEHKGRTLQYSEVEAELKGEGTREDLGKITEFLASELSLKPEKRSKFERGLKFVSSQ